jgi:fatty-acyl-CoA synthase
MAPGMMVGVGLLAPRLGLGRPGLEALAFTWAPHIALASVAAGVFGVLVALLAGSSRFWLRALLALVITTATLFGYVWDRQGHNADAATAPVEASTKR